MEQPPPHEQRIGPRRAPFYEEDDDPNNISKDDSEEFAVEDTAFFRSTTSEPSSADLLSPVPSPTTFGTPRVWSAHSLYGEALLQSTRAQSTSNNTCSSTDDDEKMFMGPQQPFIPEEKGQVSAYEDLLVSPTSPVSDTPTTPPSVAPKPPLSPPPLILPDIREDMPTPAVLPAPATALSTEAMSYSSRTPTRPPRVPGGHQAVRPSTTAATASITNNSGQVRQHRRNGSDSSVMSGLTDVSFESVQTAPPPPRSLPLPLLSASSSWTRYTNAGPGHHLPVLDNSTVSGMNISVPARLQQPFLGDEENVPANEPPAVNSNSNISTNTPPAHRQSTPPRHRPPKDKIVQNKAARPGASPQSQQRISTSRTGIIASAASSQNLARQQMYQQKSRSPPHGSVGASPNPMSFKPIQQRTRSYSSDAGETRSSPIVTKPRSFSSDVVPLRGAEQHKTTETQSLPGMCLTSPVTWRSSQECLRKDDIVDHGPIQLREWSTQAFSKTTFSRKRTDRFGAALLAVHSAPSIIEYVKCGDPPLRRKIANVASTTSEVSRGSKGTRQETLEQKPSPEKQTAIDWTEWVAITVVFSIIAGHGMVHDSVGVKLESIAFVGLQQPLLLWVARIMASWLIQNLQTQVGVWKLFCNYETRVCIYLSSGWPSLFVVWAITNWVLFISSGITSSDRQGSFDTTLRLSAVASVAALLETARRYLVGCILHSMLYRRFGRKIQKTLQRIVALRSIARFARMPARDCLTTVHEEIPEAGTSVKLADMAVLQQIYAALQSEHSLSFELGFVGNQKERTASASTLYDALAVQGRIRLTTLQEAAHGNNLLSSLIVQMFPSSSSGVVSPSDFLSAIERLRKSVEGLVDALNNEFALLGVVDTASACVFNTFSFCLGFGLFSLLPNAALSACVATWIALMVSFVLSSCLEGVIFALFTRPYDVGDTILLNRPDDPHSNEQEQKWNVEKIGIWTTVVRSEGSSTEPTLLSNPSLARYRITTFDNTTLATVSVQCTVPSDASWQKLKVFRKSVEQYLLDHCTEWIGLVAMDVVDVQKNFMEYELLVRHREPTCEFKLIRESRMNLLNFCYQAQTHLGLSAFASDPISNNSPKNTTATYNDDLSEDSMMDTENELYFSLGNSTQ